MTSRNGIVDIAPRAEASSNCGVEETPNTSGFKLSSFENPRLSVKKEENKKTKFKITDGKYRRLRLAILVSSTDFESPKFDKSIDKVKSWLAECEAFLNALYVRDLGIEFKIVDDERLMKTSLTNHQVYLENATEMINKIIGTENYDVSLAMSWNKPIEGQSGAPNMAQLNGCLWPERKAAVCVRDQTLVAVAHELDHHFGAYHTFVAYDGNGHEPNPGQSTMGYNGFAKFFCKKSLEEMTVILKQMDKRSDLVNRNYIFTNDDNRAPEFDVDKMKAEYTIPQNTFFTLDFHASDPDGDAIVYGRQQESYNAVFPTRVPTTDSRMSFGREYAANFLVVPDSDKNNVGTYDFSFYVNDGVDVEKGMCLQKQARPFLGFISRRVRDKSFSKPKSIIRLQCIFIIIGVL